MLPEMRKFCWSNKATVSTARSNDKAVRSCLTEAGVCERRPVRCTAQVFAPLGRVSTINSGLPYSLNSVAPQTQSFIIGIIRVPIY